MIARKITEIITAQPSSDGDSVKLFRVFGGRRPERFDPFLLLDEFGSNDASDYIGGFPSHPHRGFETVTYMLQGKMEHRDHMNNVGLLQDGGVQWMTAGKGIIHSEMPQQTKGKMRGLQLWINLPASHKMQPASYQDIEANQIPTYSLGGITISAIAGQATVNNQEITGYFNDAVTSPAYLDVQLQEKQNFNMDVSTKKTLLLYVYDGEITEQARGTKVKARQLARLEQGDHMTITSTDSKARFIVLAAQPIGEKIVQHGPFVMNTETEIEQAITDYREGLLTR